MGWLASWLGRGNETLDPLHFSTFLAGSAARNPEPLLDCFQEDCFLFLFRAGAGSGSFSRILSRIRPGPPRLLLRLSEAKDLAQDGRNNKLAPQIRIDFFTMLATSQEASHNIALPCESQRAPGYKCSSRNIAHGKIQKWGPTRPRSQPKSCTICKSQKAPWSKCCSLSHLHIAEIMLGIRGLGQCVVPLYFIATGI